MNQMHQIFLENFGLNNSFITPTCFYLNAKKLKFAYKKFTFLKEKGNLLSNKLARKTYASEFLRYLLDHYQILFLDECSFNINLRKNYGWGIKGNRIKMDIPNKSQNYSYLGCFSLEGMYAFIILKGGFTADCFLATVVNILKQYKKENPFSKTLLIMDNATVHKAKLLKNLLWPFQEVLFLPPYTPQLNPIEYSFNKLKNAFKKLRPRNEKNLINFLHESSKTITKVDAIGYFKKILANIRKALNMEDLI